ncbi:NAD-dependent DNA ligase LigA [Mycoplasma sp. NEAQ87857]|uniref:NAD-dependent DNA ligase LigA n=1 Tax=Mycoplasma sp. NEAQ87857 TaxID=2683967 RepID=UPI001319B5D1|nr:NAD-dependent DNA ligase LigA [Mycoplasma sp. NEAQ87857]
MNNINKKPEQKIIELTNLINEHNNNYYNLNQPTISDQEYDLLLRELEELESLYPEFIQQNSPTINVGAFANSKFQKVTHKIPMLSLAKAYSIEDIEKFVDNITKITKNSNPKFSIEPKIDGLSINLKYQNGKLIQASTRGDGKIGEDVTENIYQINSIPKFINYYQDLEVRGEVFLGKSNFLKINKQLEKEGSKTFANPRNAASGTLRQLDSKIVKQRNLNAILYDVAQPLEHNLTSQIQVINFLKDLNFNTNEYSYLANSFADLKTKISEFKDLKNTFDYDCDGLVIKYDDINQWNKLGFTAKFPKYAIAFKYETEEAITKIVDIKTTVGRSGKITYVAQLEPIELNQTTVTFATLHNYDFIYNLNININDEVKVIKSGEIIPKIIALVSKNSNDILPKTLNCPACESILEEIDDNVDQFCLNPNCDEKKIKQLVHFVSRQALNIVALGESTIRQFYEIGLITDFISIFDLKNKKDSILSLPLYQEKKTQNIIDAIEASKNITLQKALFALGIKHIGYQVAGLISKEIDKLYDLINLNLSILETINTIGTKITSSIAEYIQDSNNQELLKQLDEILIYTNQTTSNSQKLEGLIFVITGSLSKDRNYFKELIENNGGKVTSAISKNTNYLLAGEKSGSKLAKAQKLNISVINEEQFNELIK